MSFSQLFFIFLFLPLTVLVYYISSGSKAVLLIASLIFYASGSPDHIILLMLLCCITTLISLKIEKIGHIYSKSRHKRLRNSNRKKLWLILGITVNMALLGYYKYFNFLCEQFKLTPPY